MYTYLTMKVRSVQIFDLCKNCFFCLHMTSVGTLSELLSQVVGGNCSFTCEVVGESIYIYIYMPVIEQQLLIRDVCALSENVTSLSLGV
jgi:hypothetical protein